MPHLPAIVVDAHSHVFNAEDLPIDGFIKQQSPAPRLLTGVVSGPLDALSQWVAPGPKEKDRILQLLRPTDGFEGLGAQPDVVFEAELIPEGEIGPLIEATWLGLGIPVPASVTGGLETLGPVTGPSDDELAAALALAPPADVHELEAWLEEWDPELQAGAGFEGITGLFDYANKARLAVMRYVDALRLISRHRYQVAAELATTYPDVSLFVTALVDFAHTTHDNPRTDIRAQIAVHSLVSKLSIAGGLPDAPDARIAPLVGFDPYREVAETQLSTWNPDRGVANTYVPYADRSSTDPQDRYHRGIRFDPARCRALREPTGPWHAAVLDLTGVRGGIDLVRHAVELGGFVGVKLYPPAGFFPLGNALRFPGAQGERLDAALRSLYGYCEDRQVPILAHGSHSNGFGPGYDEFAGPAGWDLVLVEYPKLRVSLGHFGHLYGVGADPTNPSVDGWPRRFLDLMDRYEHVYGDVANSQLPVSTKYRTQFLTVLHALLGGDQPDDLQRKRRRRLLYGSDFWMNTLSPEHANYFTSFRDAMVATPADVARQEAFLGRNALRFLGFTGEDDEPDFANLNRQRLVAFHGPMPTPGWLPTEG